MYNFSTLQGNVFIVRSIECNHVVLFTVELWKYFVSELSSSIVKIFVFDLRFSQTAARFDSVTEKLYSKLLCDTDYIASLDEIERQKYNFFITILFDRPDISIKYILCKQGSLLSYISFVPVHY
ncbi:hypothetical protein RF11_01039 [Thelohanellus kitauei]|uniref:Uncharacterized protein n=1 Tax=Thelohanellus kitauei TaxID=669202 RepID=A0A0C2J0T8_THEKT|nr:hypothetical protein RF11_01039 [Thelohanellus kitauei]